MLKRSITAGSFVLATVATILQSSGNAGAAEPFSKTYSECVEKAGGVTPAIQDCIADEHDRQDKRLNTAYRQLLSALPEKRKTQLRDVQRKWLAFRDANCGFYGDPGGGQAGRLAANECVVRVTALRAAELEDLKE